MRLKKNIIVNGRLLTEIQADDVAGVASSEGLASSVAVSVAVQRGAVVGIVRAWQEEAGFEAVRARGRGNVIQSRRLPSIAYIVNLAYVMHFIKFYDEIQADQSATHQFTVRLRRSWVWLDTAPLRAASAKGAKKKWIRADEGG